jgi:hypothetical protein
MSGVGRKPRGGKGRIDLAAPREALVIGNEWVLGERLERQLL